MSNFVISAFADEIDPDLTVQMDVLETHGISHIEMRGVNGKGLVEYGLDEVRDIKKTLDSRGFKLSAVGSPLGKIGIKDDFAPHLELFKHTLDIAEIMECRYIRIFSFFIPSGHDPADYRDEVFKRWEIFMETAVNRNVVLCHENEKEIYGDTPERCLDLSETINSSQFKAVFDPANYIQCGVETYPHAFAMMEPHIEYMHIKDALLESGRVVPSGHGDGNIKKILSSLYTKGYDNFLTLEPH